MNVKMNWVTPAPEVSLVEIARVSSNREDKTESPEKLIYYLIKNKHLSPFEHAYLSVEIETSKAIGIQILRHRSFSFQEFSQRYQDVNKLGEIFERIEFRKQAENNRQSSTEVINGMDSWLLSDKLFEFLNDANNLYDELLKAGVAREQARMILPMCTKTKIHMTGSIRSWLSFLNVRLDGHAQLEIQLVAKEIARIFAEQFPLTYAATNNLNNDSGMFM